MTTTFSIIRVFIGFGLGFIVLPWIVLPRPRSARNTLDVIAINLLRWLAAVVVGVQVLALLRLYETLTLVILIVFATWYFKLRPGGWGLDRLRGMGDRASVAAARLGDKRERPGAQPESTSWSGAPVSGGSLRDRFRAVTDRPGLAGRIPILLLASPIIFVIVAGLVRRLVLPAQRVALSPSDSYVALTWTKQLEQNVLWPDGIYPEGMHAFLSIVHKLSFGLDLTEVIRFSGLLTVGMLIFGILYIVLRLTRDPGAAVFAAGAFALFGSRPEFNLPWLRQTGPLPQEFGLGVAVLALTFVAMAVVQRDRDHLNTVGAAALAIASIHPIPIVAFCGLTVVLAIGAGVFVRGGRGMAVKTIATTAGAALLGFMYIPIGYLVGKEMYLGVQEFIPFFGSGQEASSPQARSILEGLGHNSMSMWAALLAVAGCVGGAILMMAKRNRIRGAQMLGLSILSLAIVLSYDTRIFGVPAFYAGRLSNVVGPLLTIAFGVGLAGLLAIIPSRLGLGKAALSVIAGVVALSLFGAAFPTRAADEKGSYVEYESVARVTERIKDNHERFTYTIVGIPEQRQRILGEGFFVDLWVFARDAQVREAMDPTYQVPIPTTDVFILVEKVPNPGLELPPRAPTEEYYRNFKKRGRIMTTTYVWCETYMRYHDDMSVYYDDEDIRVYRIRHSPDYRAADESSRFKDYRWNPGALFNEGPVRVDQVSLPW